MTGIGAVANGERTSVSARGITTWLSRKSGRSSILSRCCRAKERGKEFSLTYAQYEAFAINTDYAKLKGKTSLSLSVDRVDDKLGYHWWNIKAITLRENTRKQYANIPAWMKEEIKQAEQGWVPESHRSL